MNARYPRILAVLAVTLGTTPANDTWIVREDGAGPVRVGMSLPQLNAMLHEKLPLPPAKDDQACFYVSTKKQPKLSFMMLEGRLARIDVKDPGVKTPRGIQVGDSENHALQVYGRRLKASPHKYIDNGHYLTAKSSDGDYGIRFETEDGKITTYYAGRFDAIQLVERCH
jgi:hypothetical protein